MFLGKTCAYSFGRLTGWKDFISTCHYVLFEWEICMFIRKLTFLVWIVLIIGLDGTLDWWCVLELPFFPYPYCNNVFVETISKQSEVPNIGKFKFGKDLFIICYNVKTAFIETGEVVLAVKECTYSQVGRQM